jgi:glycosyltransferase involved in cell wall biosynthesis
VLTIALHGHLSAQFGLAGGAAATRRLLEHVGCTVLPRDLQLATHPSLLQDQDSPVLKTSSCQLDLVHTNPNLLASNPELLDPTSLEAPLRIGYWAWELEAFPEGWESHFSGYDEIWSPSQFAAQSLAQRSPVPVVAVPHLPDWPRLNALLERRRRRYKPDPEPFRFLSLFDFWSTPERKNPLGAIKAFQLAFPPEEAAAVELVIKTSSSEQFPQSSSELMAAAHGDRRIRWLHELLSPAAMDDLLLSADALLSLHRSEGFGLVLADAMAIELPVIATGYSGNVEFMPPGSAALVSWQLQPIERSCGDYRQGWKWAEPNLAAAAQAMRQLVHDQALATALGQAGAAAVRERLSPERLGAIVRQRIGTLLLKPSRREVLRQLPTVLRSLD